MVRGRKSESERFPGAVDTYTLEALMRDGKALQTATSHYLGQGFPRAFDVRYTGRDGSEHHPYATSWGATTRLVGGVVMAHGDDRGLRLPPRVAPHQVVIVPIVRDDDRAEVLRLAAAVADELRTADVRVRLDDRSEVRPGFKFNEWELKGVPLRIELGSRDLAAGAVTVSRRDTGEKQQIPLARVTAAVAELLSDVQASLLESARAELERRTLRAPGGYDELIEYLRDAVGFVAAPWCGRKECEARVKDDSSATIRCLPLDEQPARQATASVAAGRRRPRPCGRRRTSAASTGDARAWFSELNQAWALMPWARRRPRARRPRPVPLPRRAQLRRQPRVPRRPRRPPRDPRRPLPRSPEPRRLLRPARPVEAADEAPETEEEAVEDPEAAAEVDAEPEADDAAEPAAEAAPAEGDEPAADDEPKA